MATSLTSVAQSGIPLVSADTCARRIEPGWVYQFFCCGEDPAALAIRLVTGSILSHTGFVYRLGGKLHTIESTFTKGVHEGDPGGYMRDGDGPFILCQWHSMTPVLSGTLIANAKSLIGKHYEIGEEVEMLLHHFDGLIPVHAEYREYFCSGMVAEASNMIPETPWPFPLDASGGNPTPVDCWNLPFVEPICAVMKGAQ